MNILLDILINIGSDVLFWLGLGLLVMLSIYAKQKGLIEFFGIKRDTEVIVYLSNLWQPQDETPQIDIVSGHEFRVTRSIDSLFGDTPFRFPELVRGLVDSFWERTKPKISFEISPADENQIRFTNMIVVGATPKNSVRRYYFKRGVIHLTIEGEKDKPISNVFAKVLDQTVRILGDNQQDNEFSGGYNFAIVEKLLDDMHNTTVFFCAGSRGDSTWTATEYLMRNWQILKKRYGKSPFALCLGFPETTNYMDHYAEPKILYSYPKLENS